MTLLQGFLTGLGVVIVAVVLALTVLDYLRTGHLHTEILTGLLGIAMFLFGGWKIVRNGGSQ